MKSPGDIELDPSGPLFPLVDALDAEQAVLSDSHRRLQLLYDLGRAVASHDDVDDVIAEVLPALGKLISTDRSFIATCENGVLCKQATSGIDLSGAPENWPISRTILSKVLERGVALLTSDAQGDTELSKTGSVELYDIRSVLAVPLGPPNAPIGVLYADHRFNTGVFTEHDLVFMTALGHHIAIALRNAKSLATAKADCERSEARWSALQHESMNRHRIVGRSKALTAAYDRLRRVASKKVPLLLVGETGTGKELFAQAAHDLSERREGVFMPVNIAAFTESLVESELFGHEKGAFTSAVERKHGRLELAHGGTLFLDEVAEIPLSVQAKLLRALETGEFERVGGIRTIHSDIRLLCATNKDLQREIEEGRFREDLYYRIRGVEVEIPPLRDRSEDIPALVAAVNERLGSRKVFDADALLALERYPWPGNVRQLVRVVEEVDAICDDDHVTASDLPLHVRREQTNTDSRFPKLNEIVEVLERQHLKDALELTGGNNERAITMLGISRGKFFDRKKTFKL